MINNNHNAHNFTHILPFLPPPHRPSSDVTLLRCLHVCFWFCLFLSRRAFSLAPPRPPPFGNGLGPRCRSHSQLDMMRYGGLHFLLFMRLGIVSYTVPKMTGFKVPVTPVERLRLSQIVAQTVTVQRPLVSQYLNVHDGPLSERQIVFLYNFFLTKKEDRF